MSPREKMMRNALAKQMKTPTEEATQWAEARLKDWQADEDVAHEEFIRLALAELHLTRDEAIAICASNNSMSPQFGSWQMQYANLQDYYLRGEEFVADDLDVDILALSQRLQNASLGHKYALTIAVTRFWNRTTEDTDVVFREIGLLQ